MHKDEALVRAYRAGWFCEKLAPNKTLGMYHDDSRLEGGVVHEALKMYIKKVLRRSDFLSIEQGRNKKKLKGLREIL